MDPRVRARHALAARPRGLGIMALSFGVVAYPSFEAGGYFPDATGVIAVTALLLLGARTALAEHPFEGIGRGAGIVLAGMGALAAWTAISMVWSHAPARALLETNRDCAYLLLAVLFAAGARRPGRVRWVARGIALGAFAVAVAALASRLAPDAFPTTASVLPDRLSFPLTYWNALALLAAIGLALILALCADPAERLWVRTGAAAAVPILACTALLTFSRGGLLVALLAVILALAFGRPSGAPGALLAVIPPSVVALVFTYRASLLSSEDPTSAAATAQGHRTGLVILGCALAAAAARVLAELRLGDLLRRLRAPRLPRSRWARAGVALALAGALAVPVAAQVRGFARAPASADARGRLTDLSGNGRLDYWRAALGAFSADPLQGSGAGTYQLDWWQRRPVPSPVTHAHSVYLETLGELGLVGFGLLAVTLAGLLVGLARRLRGEERVVGGALLAAAVAWAIHAGLDWDWQMPAVTGWLFAAGGVALARAPAARARRRIARPLRAIPAAGLAILALLPGAVAISEHELERGLDAYAAGSCRIASQAEDDAHRAMPMRPEPEALLGFCAARSGRYRVASTRLRSALERDPRNWEYHFGLAIVEALGGRNPRPQLDEATRLNPREPLIADTAAGMAGGASAWERQARQASLSLDGLLYPPIG